MSILIKSSDKTISSNSTHAFTVEFDRVLQGNYQVVNVNISNSRYNIHDNNDQVYVNYNGSGVSTLTLPHGFYTSSTITSALEVVLKTVDSGFSATYNSNTKKITIAHATAFVMAWSDTINSAANTLGWVNSDTVSSTSNTSTGVINLGLGSGIAILIDVDEAEPLFNSSDSSSNLRGNIYIPLSVSFGSYQQLLYTDLPQMISIPKPTKSLKIRLYDVIGNVFDLNNTDWSMLLQKI
jgi:hypothetical protein